MEPRWGSEPLGRWAFKGLGRLGLSWALERAGEGSGGGRTCRTGKSCRVWGLCRFRKSVEAPGDCRMIRNPFRVVWYWGSLNQGSSGSRNPGLADGTPLGVRGVGRWVFKGLGRWVLGFLLALGRSGSWALWRWRETGVGHVGRVSPVGFGGFVAFGNRLSPRGLSDATQPFQGCLVLGVLYPG